MTRILYFSFLLLLFLRDGLSGQSAESIKIGQTVTIYSEILKEERKLLLYLPESYEESTLRYPIFYLLDAGSEFLHTIGIVEFLSSTDQIPELIIVGVTNTNRSRDLTPKSSDTTETAFWDEVGGADRFLMFFNNELIPFIDKTYRTEPYRIIRGQSFGGLFALYDYISNTPTFNAYLTSSSAIAWNYGELLKKAKPFFENRLTRPLYLSAGRRDFAQTVKDIENFVSILEEKLPQKELWRYEFFKEEGHYSLVHLSSYNALKFLYKDWQVPDSIASHADFEAYEQHYARLSKKYGYRIKIPMRSVIRLGNKLLREKRFVEGIVVKKHNLELYPDQPDSYWHVGDAYILSGELEKAKPFLKKAYEKALKIGMPNVEDYKHSLEELEAKLDEIKSR